MPRYLTRTTPVYLQRSRPSLMKIGATLEGREQGGAPSAPATLPLWGFFYYSYNLGDPNDFASIAGTSMLKGLNWPLWKAALTARVLARGGNPAAEIVEDASTVTLVGEVNIDAASMCDRAVLGHAPPKEHIQAIKARSTAPNGTKVDLGLLNYESINQGPEYQPRLEILRLAVREYVDETAVDPSSGCTADGKNRYGCTCIDQLERSNSGISQADWIACGGTPSYPAGIVACPHTPAHAGLPPNATVFTKHTWDAPVAAEYLQLADELLSEQEGMLSGEYIVGGLSVIDGVLYDNARAHRTFSAPDGPSNALAAPENDDEAYRVGWRWFAQLQRIWSDGSPWIAVPARWFWVNTGDQTAHYSAADMPNRWEEFFFVDPSGAKAREWTDVDGISQALERIAAEGMHVVLGLTGSYTAQHYWATTTGGPNPSLNGTWAQLVAKVRELGIADRVFAQALRQTSAGGYIFWQEGWREPKA